MDGPKSVRELLGRVQVGSDTSEQAQSADDDVSFESLLANTLAKHSCADIQNAFNKALLELTGKDLRTEITYLNLKPKWAGAISYGSSELRLHVTPPPWTPPDDTPTPS
jgi:hypothetical protein